MCEWKQSKRGFLHTRDSSSRQQNELPHATAVICVQAEHPEILMDREHEDTAGKVMGDKKMQTEGKADKAKGSARNVAGDVKDAVKQSSE